MITLPFFSRKPTKPTLNPRQQWVNSLPIQDESTLNLWNTVCECSLGDLFELAGERVVYVRTHGGEYSRENWWVLDSEGYPTEYFRDFESVSDYLGV